jgi:ectoine hydroxylase-related dioxygenase (phytanoyl-CoA dioxygenase family)
VVLDGAQIDAFQSDGAVAIRGALSDDWIELLRGVVESLRDAVRANPAPGMAEPRPGATSGVGLWRIDPTFARFLFRSPVARLAAEATKSRTARLFEDLLLYTESAVPGAPWHRDAPHWPVSGRQLASTWFSLEPTTAETGALRFVAGSHLDGDEVRDEGLMPDFDAASEHRPILRFDTEPGDVLLFHPRIMHGTTGAPFDRPRRTFTLRFAGDDVRWRPRRMLYYEWMGACGLERGDVLDHPWFPLVADTGYAGE